MPDTSKPVRNPKLLQRIMTAAVASTFTAAVTISLPHHPAFTPHWLEISISLVWIALLTDIITEKFQRK